MRLLIYIVPLVVIVSSCKKPLKEDNLNTENKKIQGYIFNTCTGKPFPKVEVLLREKVSGSGSSFQTIKTLSDEDGNFFFDILINHSEKYTYEVVINSYSNQNYEFFGVGGTIDKTKLSEKLTLGVSATFNNCHFAYPEGVNNVFSPDTFTLIFSQHTFHYYEPNHSNWQRFMYPSTINPSDISVPNWRNRMGMWHIYFEKEKDGVHSIIHDSIYFEMGESKEYVIPW
jgi:hypothetical protein